jgi:hypothetical protein
MSFVHDLHAITSSEASNRNIAVGPGFDAEGADVSRTDDDLGWLFRCEFRVPKDGLRGDEFLGGGEGIDDGGGGYGSGERAGG